MYTIIERRKVNPERLQETTQRAESDFFPKLRAADGFTGFYLVPDEAQGIYTAIVVWASKAQADAFEAESSAWQRTLEQHGHAHQSANRGETVVQLEPAR